MTDYDALAKGLRVCQCIVEGLATQLDCLSTAIGELARAQQAQSADGAAVCLHDDKTEVATMTDPTAWLCKTCGVRGH